VAGADAEIERVAAWLRRSGRDPQTPVARVVAGTTPRQRTVTGTLASLPPIVGADGSGARSVLVVGDAVRQRSRLSWFESRPLFGRSIVVTRPRAQASSFVAGLESLGAEVVQFPTIRVEPVADAEPLLQAAREAGGFDWIVFTSANGVAHFWTALRRAGRDSRSLAGVSVCAIGPATAAALDAHGIRADLLPERYVAESVVEALSGRADVRGKRVLLPRAELARAVLPDELRARGADVVEVVAYRTLPDAMEAGWFRQRLEAGAVDVITFTSSSTVQNFVALIGTDIGQARVAAIGPVTASTARELGLPVDVEAEEYTVPGLIQAILRHFADATYEPR
jgi:uroporphyrinogen III methyltransferase / synthase